MLEQTGIATKDLIDGAYPDEKRRRQGAFAVAECFQKIPCNPCYSSCPRGAMKPMDDINDLPKVVFDKCNGCGVCATNCPGLAIFIVDETYSENEALVKLPYEFLPLPAKGDIVDGTNRMGEKVCKAVVRNVVSTKAQDRTPMVWLSVPKEFSAEVRCFVAGGGKANEAVVRKDGGCKDCDCTPLEKVKDGTDSGAYVCRCEEITVSDIQEYIAKGYATLEEIKRVSRAGMGACQGRTCRQLIMNEISRATGQKPAAMTVTTFRPPVKPIKMALLCQESDSE